MKVRYNPQSWHSFLRINNPTLLGMYLRDGHLRDGVAINDETERRLDDAIAEYCQNEPSDRIDKVISKFALLFTHSGRDIEDVTEQYIAHERQVIDEVNRGHIKHSLGCVLLAHYLLEFDADCLLQARPRPLSRRGYPRGELIQKLLPELKYPYKGYLLDPFLWLLFFHDWGYLHQVPSLRQKQLVDLVEVTELEEVLKGSPMCRERKKPVDELWDVIQREYAESRDHGVASSLILLKKLGELPPIRAKDEDELFEELGRDTLRLQELKKEYYREALSAIAMHNLPLGRHGYKFNICDNVYYFLLKLVDEIVDFSRPVMNRFWRAFEPLDCILLNVRGQPEGQPKMLIQTIVNFRDNEHLFEAASKIRDFDKDDELFEISKLKEKAEALKVLDFKDPSTNQKWLDFEMILIDRNGRIHHLYWDDDKPVVVSEDMHQPVYQL